MKQVAAELVLPESSTSAGTQPAVDLVILLPPDQVLDRWRRQEQPPSQALEKLLQHYSEALNFIQQGVDLLMESELLGSTAIPANPLIAATLLQILTVHPSLRSALKQLDQSTSSNDLSLQRLQTSCQSPQALLHDWWDPHQGEAQIYQQLLLQQEAQQRRLMAQLGGIVSP
ncbi:hypothetical protein SynA1840_00416 [Synechococcus sp. A18-40]|nr:hypothetical protein SynA1840_00416 [Synechococcus sp. A18-40]